MASEDIDINVVVSGKEDLQNLSVTMRNLLLSSKNLAAGTRNLDSRQRGLNALFGSGQKHAGDYAKSLRETINNQKILGQEIQKTSADIRRFNAAVRSGVGGTGLPALVSNLDKTNKALKASRVRLFASDLRSVGIEMKRVGKDAQFVGRSLIIGLTAPVIAFGRAGVQNFYAVEKQLVRLEKLLGTSREKFDGLTRAVEGMSYEFGVAKELLLGVAGDFAELGINSDAALEGLTKITAQFAVLGDMDISAAQDLTQTLYQGVLNTMNLTGEILNFNTTAQAQEFALKRVRGQMVLFNAIENATALSMREIAQTLPEVSAAGQVFGLSFTEMMAILAPMKAIGIDVGAAATGIKVSFQKMVNPTNKMTEELKALSDEAKKLGDFQLADDFLDVKGVGMDAIQALVNVTDKLQKTASGSEEVLNFYSELFDDRQSTRMLVAMRDLATFQAGFFPASMGKTETSLQKFISAINESLKGTGLFVKDVQTLSEVTALANASIEEGADKVFLQSLNREATAAEITAAKNARKVIAKINEDAYMDTTKKATDMVEEITSESGKAMMIAMLGSQSAMSRAEKELTKAKESTAMSIDRIKIAFKNLSADFIATLAPTIEKVSAKFIELVDAITALSPEMKTLIVGAVGLAAALGPMVFIFGQLKMGFGVLLEGAMRLVPGLKAISLNSLSAESGLMYMKKALTMQGDTVINANSRFSTLIGTLATGNGPIARMARGFGQMTGILSKTKTAADDVTKAMDNMSLANQRAISQAMMNDIMPGSAQGQAPAKTVGKGISATRVELDAEKELIVDRQKKRGLFGTKMFRPPTDAMSRSNVMRAKSLGVTTGQLDVGEELFFRDAMKAKRIGDLGTRRFQSLETGRFMKQNIAERTARSLMGKRLTAGLGRGIEYGIGEGGRGEASFAGRVLSAAQERRLAVGGVAGLRQRTAFRAQDIGRSVVGKATDIGKSASGFNAVTGSVKRFNNSIDMSRKRVKDLVALNSSFGQSTSMFAKGRVGMLGFVQGIFQANKAFTILKMTMLASGIGVIVLGLAAAIVIVIKNFDKIRTAAAPGIEALKRAFEIVKSTLEALIKPFLDFIGMLAGNDKGANGANKIAEAFNKIAAFVEKAAKMVQEFVNKFVVPLLYRALTAVMNIIKGIITFIKGIIKLKDNWREGLKMMLDGLKKIGGAILGFFVGTVIKFMVMAVFEGVKLIVKLFFGMAKGVVSIYSEMVKLNINIMFALAEAGLSVVDYIILAFSYLPRGIGNGVQAAADVFADFVDGIAESIRGTPFLGWLADKAGIVGAARSVADGLRNIGNTIGEAGRDTADFMNRLLDSPRQMLTNLKNTMLDGVDSISGSLEGILGDISDGIVGGIDSFGDGLANWLDNFGRNEIGKGAGDAFLDNTKDEVEEGIGDVLDPTVPDAGAEAGEKAGKEAGKEFNDAFADALKDLQQKFVDLVLDSLKSSIDEATEQLAEALNKQKDQALAVYDAQIEALDKLQKAEESLTKEKEYQLERRRMLDERELQRTNYIRNRALAIYEGRIDDARMLFLQDIADQREFNTGITKIDEDRRKDLISENIDYLRESIALAKEETARLIEEQIEKFQEAAKEITKFPPLTIEEYTNQLGQLNEIATGVAGENGNILKHMMDSMAMNLQMPNENLGVFATGLDQLVTVAKQKYGLLNSNDKNSIVGATVAMLAGIQGQFITSTTPISNAFQGIVDNVFDVASTIDKVSTDIVAPALADIEKIIVEKNPFKALEKAVKDANETILREMQRTVGHVASIVDNLTALISKTLIELTRAQVAAQQAGQQAGQPPAQGGAPPPPSSSRPPSTGGPPNTGAPPAPGPGSAPAESIRTMVSRIVGSMVTGTADARERQIQQVITLVTTILKDGVRSGNPLNHVLSVINYMMQTNSIGNWPNRGAHAVFRNGPQINQAIALARAGKFYNGGKVVPGFGSQSVPAILHGGEFVVSSKAVSSIGLAALNSLNNMRYMTPSGFRGGYGGGQMSGGAGGYSSSKTENINIYVENFIGEDEWFNSMVKKYNMNILPRNQKAAGMENRVVTTYNGLSRGM